MPLSKEYCLDYTKDFSTSYCLLQWALEPLGIKAMKRRQLTLPACHLSGVSRSGESLAERVLIIDAGARIIRIGFGGTLYYILIYIYRERERENQCRGLNN